MVNNTIQNAQNPKCFDIKNPTISGKGHIFSLHLTPSVYCTVWCMCNGAPQNILGLGHLKVLIRLCIYLCLNVCGYRYMINYSTVSLVPPSAQWMSGVV